MSISGVPSLRSLLVGFSFDPLAAEIETSDLELPDAALLHRDPQAERSRLTTRGFRVGALRTWWMLDEPQELLARVALYRMGDPMAAGLGVADSWSELHAGNARIARSDATIVALVSEDHVEGTPVWTALAFGCVAEIVVAVIGCAANADDATRSCVALFDAQMARLRAP